jgi:hypothetical protein
MGSQKATFFEVSQPHHGQTMGYHILYIHSGIRLGSYIIQWNGMYKQPCETGCPNMWHGTQRYDHWNGEHDQ